MTFSIARNVSPPLSPAAKLRFDIVKRLITELQPESLIEIGLGLGGMSWHLARVVSSFIGYEPDPQAFGIAAQRLDGIAGASVVNDYLPPTAHQAFDGLVAFEVLEHIDNDEDTLKAWAAWVKPGGFIMLSVPAKSARFGPYDAAVGHFRRYDRSKIVGLLATAGLVDVRIQSYGMPLGYLLEFVRNKILARRLAPHGDIAMRTLTSGRSFQPNSGARLIAALTLPFCVLQRPFVKTNWGIGWVIVGRKPSR